MSNIIHSIGGKDNNSSPFDEIRGYRADGSEYWTARELMKWLGYTSWRQGEIALNRTIKSIKNQGHDVTANIVEVYKLSNQHNGKVSEIRDYELSRFACYIAAMNSDPDKDMVAQAQGYFAVQAYKQELAVENLEKQFLPKVSPKEIDDIAAIFGKRFGEAYEQRLLTQNMKKFHPHIEIPVLAPSEVASLPTATALLTPTQLGAALNWFCKTNLKVGDARKVNRELERLGYQVKTEAGWSATQKAIDVNLCDRKPVETGSRTQKDQLLWSANIISILQENLVG